MPQFPHRKKWTGWDLNPRPQPTFWGNYHLKGRMKWYKLTGIGASRNVKPWNVKHFLIKKFLPTDLSKALLRNLSDNCQNQVQNNTVGVQQKEWTGWELNPRPQPVFFNDN